LMHKMLKKNEKESKGTMPQWCCVKAKRTILPKRATIMATLCVLATRQKKME